MLISEETIENINLLIQSMFDRNRTLDRMLGYCDVKWAMKHFGEVFHAGYAHLMPLMADLFADILLRYNVAPKYYETHSDTREYNDLLSMFETNLEEDIKSYELIKTAIATAQLNGDINVEADLKRIMRIWNQFVNQSIILRDKAEMYKDNVAMFDGFCDQFYALDTVKDILEGKDIEE